MKTFQFNRVLLHARFELDRFETSLSRLEAYEFPSDVAKILIESQRRESQATELALTEIANDFSDDPHGASARLASIYRKQTGRRRFLEVLEKSRSDEVPWSLIPSIESLASRILPNRPILVTTTSDMNYMVGWSSSPDHPIVTIFLPKLHRSNAFLHILIGHELFHPLIEEFLKIEKLSVIPKLRNDCKQLLEEIDKSPPDLFSAQRLDAILNYAMEAWERAITELMCDMGAAAIFGPAALWTISAFASSHDLDIAPSRDNQFYPPWRMRVREVLEYVYRIDNGESCINGLFAELDRAGLTEHTQAIRNSLEEEKQTVASDSGSKKSPSDPIMPKVYEHVNGSLQNARAFINSKTINIADRWASTYKETPELLKRLRLLVPPSELIVAGKQSSDAAKITAIVLACWIERVKMENDGSLGLNEYRRLCRLMLKALEDAELKRQFSEWSAK